MKDKWLVCVFVLIQLTWGIIQSSLGFLIFVFFYLIDHKNERFLYKGAIVTRWKLKGSCCVGLFIFLGSKDHRVLAHEYGHYIQSCLLGPFYLSLVGIPSFFWCNLPLFDRQRKKGKYRYSSFYTEKWANHLGQKYTNQNTINY